MKHMEALRSDFRKDLHKTQRQVDLLKFFVFILVVTLLWQITKVIFLVKSDKTGEL